MTRLGRASVAKSSSQPGRHAHRGSVAGQRALSFGAMRVRLCTRSPSWTFVALVVVGYAVEVALRLYLDRGRVGPLAVPDEPGYLLNARILSGTGPGDPDLALQVHGGYSLLLVPAYWLAHDPATVYRLVLAINALLGSLLFPIGYLLGTRIFGFGRALAVSTAFGICLLPEMVFYSQFALADAVMPVLVTGWLLCLGMWLRGGRAPSAWALASAVIASFTYSVHQRGDVIALLEALVLVGVFAVSRRRRVTAGSVLAVALVGIFFAEIFNRWIANQNTPSWSPKLKLLSDTISGVPYRDVAVRALGEVWALGPSTLGLSFVVMTAGVAVIVRRHQLPERRLVLGLLLVGVLAVGVSAAVKLSPDAVGGDSSERVGSWVYSRYVSCFTPGLVIAGIWLLAVCRRIGARAAVSGVAGAAIVGVILTAAVQVWAGSHLRTGAFVSFDFPAVMPLTWTWDHFELWATIGVVFAVFGAALVSARWLAPPLVLVIVGCLVGVPAAFAERSHVIAPWDSWAWTGGATHLALAHVGPPMRLGMWNRSWYKRTSLSFEAYWTPVVGFYDPLDKILPRFDAFLIPTEKDESSLDLSYSAATTFFLAHHWHMALHDAMWTIWVSPTAPKLQ